MNVSTRVATVDDAALLLELVRRYYAYDGIAFAEAPARRALDELLATPALGRALLLLVDGAIAGYAIATFGFDVEFGGRLAVLTDLFLDETMRRRGLGSALLAAVERELRAAGAHALELSVESDNDEARAFYARHGFRPLSRLPHTKPLT